MSYFQVPNFTLKSISEITSNFGGNAGGGYIVSVESYSAMYIRTQFNITMHLNGVEQYYATKYKPELVSVTASVQGQGILSSGSKGGNVDYHQLPFYEILKQNMDSYVRQAFLPQEMIVTNQFTNDSIGKDKTYVIQNDISIIYDLKVVNMTKHYNVYYPSKNIPNGIYISLSLSASDKTQSSTEKKLK